MAIPTPDSGPGDFLCVGPLLAACLLSCTLDPCSQIVITFVAIPIVDREHRCKSVIRASAEIVSNVPKRHRPNITRRLPACRLNLTEAHCPIVYRKSKAIKRIGGKRRLTTRRRLLS
jgi:hypothetical protein